MKRKILLVNPGYNEMGDYGYYDQPPMGLLKIGNYLKSKGHEVSLLDSSIIPRLVDTKENLKTYHKNAPFIKYLKCGNYEEEGIIKAQRYYGKPLSQIKYELEQAQPSEIWLGTGLTYYWETVYDMANLIKSVYPRVPLLCGGLYPTLFPDHAKKHIQADLIHEGPLPDIDHLYPDYSISPNISTQRTFQLGKGCHLKVPCSFCAVTTVDPKFIGVNDLSSFEYIKQEYDNGARFFRIWSSQLLVPPIAFKSLMRRIIDSGISISLVASEGVQPSLFTQEIADLMYKAGFIAVSIPMESIEEKSTEEFRKPSDLNDYTKAVVCAQKAGFKLIKSFVMMGIPGQTYEEIIKSIVDCWSRDVQPALHQYTPIPGSYDWTRFKQFHNISPELLHPSLWPGASKSLTVENLELIKYIAKIGYINLKKYIDHKIIKDSEVLQLYIKWSKHYNVINNDLTPTFKRVNVLPEYTSGWTDRYKCK